MDHFSVNELNCTRFDDLRALMSKELQLVGAMKPAELAKAIAMPSIKVGAEIDPALVKTVLEDMKGEPGALPLMSFALRDLFDAEKTEPGKPMDLMLQEYLDRGGIEKALERHANRVFDEFSPRQQKLAEGIFSRLVEIGQGRVDTRRTATFSELVPKDFAPDEVAAVVQKLAQEETRLVTTDGAVEHETIAEVEVGSTTMTLAHERLIDAWPWLRRLVDDNRAMIGLVNQIEADAQRWEQERDEGFLYSGGRLLQAEEMLEQFKPNLSKLSTRFIETSQQKRQEVINREKQVNANLRRRALWLSIAGLVALLFAVAAGLFGIEANIQRDSAEGNATQAAFSLSTATIALAAAEAAEATATRSLATVEVALDDANEQRLSAEGNATQAAYNLSTATVALATSEAAQATAVWNENKAQQQASIALARQLAAQSVSEISNNQYEPAILLAIESGKERDVLESFSAIRSAIAHPWHSRTVLDGHTFEVRQAAWSADESQILTSSIDGTARVWDAETGQALLKLDGHRVTQATWSGDESQILTSSDDGTARVWDAETGQELTILEGHIGSVLQARWSADERKILTGSGDGTVRVWDAETGQELTILEGHIGSVLQARWSADERKILTSSDDGTVRIWYVQLAELIEAACDWVPRNFTWAEWGRYMRDSQQAYRPTCPRSIIPLDSIEGVKGEARELILAADMDSAIRRLEELNGWLQVNGQFKSRGIHIEAFVAEVSATATPTVLPTPPPSSIPLAVTPHLSPLDSPLAIPMQ